MCKYIGTVNGIKQYEHCDAYTVASNNFEMAHVRLESAQHDMQMAETRLDDLIKTHMPGPVRLVQAPQQSNGIAITSPGVFELNGEIFIVKPNKDGTRMYAKKLVEAPSPRVTETGNVVDFDFEYAKGAIYKLTEADRMDIERAKELMIRYGKCIVCGRLLKVAESVERGIGPVCIKYFKGPTGDV